jgi:hypothetical protein
MSGYAIAALVVLAFAGCAVLVDRVVARPWVVRLVIIAAFVAGFALIAWERRVALYLQVPISIDEAQFLADAIKVKSGGWVPWVDFDTGTVGFVVPYALVPVVVLLPTMPYLGAGLVAIACAVGWSVGGYLALRTRVSASTALMLAAPMLAIAALPGAGDLLAFSSELVPLALTFLGVGLAVRGAARDRSTVLVLVGFVLMGLVPFGKLQVAPLAFVYAAVIVLALLVRTRRDGWRPVAAALVGGLLPAACIAVGCVISAEFREKAQSSLLFVQGYQEGGDPWPVTLRWFLQAPLLRALAESAIALVVVALIVVVLTRQRRSIDAWLLVVLAAVSPIGLVCMALPGRGFFHYVWVGAVPVVFALAAATASVVAVRRVSRRGRGRVGVPVAVGLVVIVLSIQLAGVNVRANGLPFRLTVDEWSWLPYFPDGRLATSPTGFGEDQEAVRVVVRQCSGPVAVWGWDPGILVATDRPYVGRTSVIAPSDPLAADQWARAVSAAQPDCIIDASGPNHFQFSCDGCHVDQQSFSEELLKDYHRIYDTSYYRVWQRNA